MHSKARSAQVGFNLARVAAHRFRMLRPIPTPKMMPTTPRLLHPPLPPSGFRQARADLHRLGISDQNRALVGAVPMASVGDPYRWNARVGARTREELRRPCRSDPQRRRNERPLHAARTGLETRRTEGLRVAVHGYGRRTGRRTRGSAA